MKGYVILALSVIGLTGCDKEGEPGGKQRGGEKVAVKSKSAETVPSASETEKAGERRQASTRPPIEKKPAPKPEPKGYPVAQAAPGQKGFVTSPYSKGMVDVRDIPPGTLVQDPTAPAGEKLMFRVPEEN